MISGAVRKANLAALAKRGFRVAPSLPLARGPGDALRPVGDIATRLMALDALFTWVVYDENQTPAAKLRRYIAKNELEKSMTRSERAVLKLARPSAQRRHGETIGWRLENMWPLAWVLGFPRAPTVDGKMIPRATAQKIVAGLPRLTETTAVLLESARPRKLAAVERLEDLFYCCHNAVRSAQLGGKTVPARFDPVAAGGVIHERRHALTWCLSPGTAWDDTDLST